MKSIFSFSSIPSIPSIPSMSSIFRSSKKPLSNANKRRETLNKQITNTIYLCYNEYNKDKKINNFEKILFNELINESKFNEVFDSINNCPHVHIHVHCMYACTCIYILYLRISYFNLMVDGAEGPPVAVRRVFGKEEEGSS